MNLAGQLSTCRVLPVIIPHDVESTLCVAQSLQKGGMQAVEITMRTTAALESLREVKSALPALLVAAGTVTTPENLQLATSAGADFCVSPGVTQTLLREAKEQGVRLLPGVATATEVMLGMELGYELFKFFPAVAAGGLPLLKSLAGPFPTARFCPTGGLNSDNFRDFLALPNVICCGGSWMVADSLVESNDWDEIERLAKEAVQETGEQSG
jgi:2-dehydro-3-deoxyphosphogluconate aldolase/(4S)-4-hydroxy-2-oxoglutarate aldolase